MTNFANSLEKNLHIVYNEYGKSFEELLAEAIQQVNLQRIQKEIITNATPEKGAIAND